MNLIELSQIGKSYCDGDTIFEALKEVSLSVKSGEMLALTGRSGAGKTTLLNIMGCIGSPSCGMYCFEDRPVDFKNKKQMAEHRNRSFGIVLQDFGLIEYRNVIENVEVPLIFNRSVPKSEMGKLCEDALRSVDMLCHKRKEAWRLSGGEKQRVAIARAIVNRPKVLLADEPTGSLDHYSRNMVMEIFKQLNENCMTVVIVTHDLEIAKQCKRVVQLENGEISKTDSLFV